MNPIEIILKDAIIELDCPAVNELRNNTKDKLTVSEFDECLGRLLRKNWILIDKGDIVWIHNPKSLKILKKKRNVYKGTKHYIYGEK